MSYLLSWNKCRTAIVMSVIELLRGNLVATSHMILIILVAATTTSSGVSVFGVLRQPHSYIKYNKWYLLIPRVELEKRNPLTASRAFLPKSSD